MFVQNLRCLSEKLFLEFTLVPSEIWIIFAFITMWYIWVHVYSRSCYKSSVHIYWFDGTYLFCDQYSVIVYKWSLCRLNRVSVVLHINNNFYWDNYKLLLKSIKPPLLSKCLGFFCKGQGLLHRELRVWTLLF